MRLPVQGGGASRGLMPRAPQASRPVGWSPAPPRGEVSDVRRFEVEAGDAEGFECSCRAAAPCGAWPLADSADTARPGAPAWAHTGGPEPAAGRVQTPAGRVRFVPR